MEKIIEYYLLCSVGQSAAHVVASLPPKELAIIFTNKEVELYLIKRDGQLMANESVIGGAEEVIVVI